MEEEEGGGVALTLALTSKKGRGGKQHVKGITDYILNCEEDEERGLKPKRRHVNTHCGLLHFLCGVFRVFFLRAAGFDSGMHRFNVFVERNAVVDRQPPRSTKAAGKRGPEIKEAGSPPFAAASPPTVFKNGASPTPSFFKRTFLKPRLNTTKPVFPLFPPCSLVGTRVPSYELESPAVFTRPSHGLKTAFTRPSHALHKPFTRLHTPFTRPSNTP